MRPAGITGVELEFLEPVQGTVEQNISYDYQYSTHIVPELPKRHEGTASSSVTGKGSDDVESAVYSVNCADDAAEYSGQGVNPDSRYQRPDSLFPRFVIHIGQV